VTGVRWTRAEAEQAAAKALVTSAAGWDDDMNRVAL
jgi:hypothetical protein